MENDENDVIDIPAGGYSYFREQQIEGRSGASAAIDMPEEDLAAYVHASALKEKWNRKEKGSFPPSSNPTMDENFGQQSISRARPSMENLLTPTISNRRPALGQIPSSSRNKFPSQQGNFPSRSPLSTMNSFA